MQTSVKKGVKEASFQLAQLLVAMLLISSSMVYALDLSAPQTTVSQHLSRDSISLHQSPGWFGQSSVSSTVHNGIVEQQLQESMKQSPGISLFQNPIVLVDMQPMTENVGAIVLSIIGLLLLGLLIVSTRKRSFAPFVFGLVSVAGIIVISSVALANPAIDAVLEEQSLSCLGDLPTDVVAGTGTDGQVNFNDFISFAGAFGRKPPTLEYDIVADGIVDFSDFLSFVSNFGSKVFDTAGDGFDVQDFDTNGDGLLTDADFPFGMPSDSGAAEVCVPNSIKQVNVAKLEALCENGEFDPAYEDNIDCGKICTPCEGDLAPAPDLELDTSASAAQALYALTNGVVAVRDPCLDLNFNYVIDQGDWEILEKCHNNDESALGMCAAAGLLDVDVQTMYDEQLGHPAICSFEVVAELDSQHSLESLDEMQETMCPKPNCYAPGKRRCIEVGQSYLRNNKQVMATCVGGQFVYRPVEQRCQVDSWCAKEDVVVRDVATEVIRVGMTTQVLHRYHGDIVEGTGGLCEPHLDIRGRPINGTGRWIPNQATIDAQMAARGWSMIFTQEDFDPVWALAQNITDPFNTTSDNNVRFNVPMTSDRVENYQGRCFGIWTPPDFLCDGTPIVASSCDEGTDGFPNLDGYWKIGGRFSRPVNYQRLTGSHELMSNPGANGVGVDLTSSGGSNLGGLGGIGPGITSITGHNTFTFVTVDPSSTDATATDGVIVVGSDGTLNPSNWQAANGGAGTPTGALGLTAIQSGQLGSGGGVTSGVAGSTGVDSSGVSTTGSGSGTTQSASTSGGGASGSSVDLGRELGQQDVSFEIRTIDDAPPRQRLTVKLTTDRVEGVLKGKIQLQSNLRTGEQVQIQVTDVDDEFYDLNTISSREIDSRGFIVNDHGNIFNGQTQAVSGTIWFGDHAICVSHVDGSWIDGCLADDHRYRVRARILNSIGTPVTEWKYHSRDWAYHDYFADHQDVIPPYIEMLRQVEQDVVSFNDYRWSNPDIDPVVIEEDRLGLVNDVKWRFKEGQVDGGYFFQLQFSNDAKFWQDVPGADMIPPDDVDYHVSELAYRPNDKEKYWYNLHEVDYPNDNPYWNNDAFGYAPLGAVKYHRHRAPIDKFRVMHLGSESCTLTVVDTGETECGSVEHPADGSTILHSGQLITRSNFEDIVAQSTEFSNNHADAFASNNLNHMILDGEADLSSYEGSCYGDVSATVTGSNTDSYNNCLAEGLYIYRVRVVNEHGYPISSWGTSDYMEINYTHWANPEVNKGLEKVIKNIIESREIGTNADDPDAREQYDPDELDYGLIKRSVLAHAVEDKYNIGDEFDPNKLTIVEGQSGWKLGRNIAIAIAITIASKVAGNSLQAIEGSLWASIANAVTIYIGNQAKAYIGSTIGSLVCGQSPSCVQLFTIFSTSGTGGATNFVEAYVQREARNRLSSAFGKICSAKSGTGGNLCRLSNDYATSMIVGLSTGNQPSTKAFLKAAEDTVLRYAVREVGDRSCGVLGVSRNNDYGNNLCKTIGEIALDATYMNLRNTRQENKQGILRRGANKYMEGLAKDKGWYRGLKYMQFFDDTGSINMTSFAAGIRGLPDEGRAKFRLGMKYVNMVREPDRYLDFSDARLKIIDGDDGLFNGLLSWQSVGGCALGAMNHFFDLSEQFSIPITGGAIPRHHLHGIRNQIRAEVTAYQEVLGDEAANDPHYQTYQKLDQMLSDDKIDFNEVQGVFGSDAANALDVASSGSLSSGLATAAMAGVSGLNQERDDCIKKVQNRAQGFRGMLDLSKAKLRIFLETHVVPIYMDVGLEQSEIQRIVDSAVRSIDAYNNEGSRINEMINVFGIMNMMVAYDTEDEIDLHVIAAALFHQDVHDRQINECKINERSLVKHTIEKEAYVETWNMYEQLMERSDDFETHMGQVLARNDACIRAGGVCVSSFLIAKAASSDEAHPISGDNLFDFLMENDPIYNEQLYRTFECASGTGEMQIGNEFERLFGTEYTTIDFSDVWVELGYSDDEVADVTAVVAEASDALVTSGRLAELVSDPVDRAMFAIALLHYYTHVKNIQDLVDISLEIEGPCETTKFMEEELAYSMMWPLYQAYASVNADFATFMGTKIGEAEDCLARGDVCINPFIMARAAHTDEPSPTDSSTQLFDLLINNDPVYLDELFSVHDCQTYEDTYFVGDELDRLIGQNLEVESDSVVAAQTDTCGCMRGGSFATTCERYTHVLDAMTREIGGGPLACPGESGCFRTECFLADQITDYAIHSYRTGSEAALSDDNRVREGEQSLISGFVIAARSICPSCSDEELDGEVQSYAGLVDLSRFGTGVGVTYERIEFESIFSDVDMTGIRVATTSSTGSMTMDDPAFALLEPNAQTQALHDHILGAPPSMLDHELLLLIYALASIPEASNKVALLENINAAELPEHVDMHVHYLLGMEYFATQNYQRAQMSFSFAAFSIDNIPNTDFLLESKARYGEVAALIMMIVEARENDDSTNIATLLSSMETSLTQHLDVTDGLERNRLRMQLGDVYLTQAIREVEDGNDLNLAAGGPVNLAETKFRDILSDYEDVIIPSRQDGLTPEQSLKIAAQTSLGQISQMFSNPTLEFMRMGSRAFFAQKSLANGPQTIFHEDAVQSLIDTIDADNWTTTAEDGSTSTNVGEIYDDLGSLVGSMITLGLGSFHPARGLDDLSNTMFSHITQDVWETGENHEAIIHCGMMLIREKMACNGATDITAAWEMIDQDFKAYCDFFGQSCSELTPNGYADFAARYNPAFPTGTNIEHFIPKSPSRTYGSLFEARRDPKPQWFFPPYRQFFATGSCSPNDAFKQQSGVCGMLKADKIGMSNDHRLIEIRVQGFDPATVDVLVESQFLDYMILNELKYHSKKIDDIASGIGSYTSSSVFSSTIRSNLDDLVAAGAVNYDETSREYALLETGSLQIDTLERGGYTPYPNRRYVDVDDVWKILHPLTNPNMNFALLLDEARADGSGVSQEEYDRAMFLTACQYREMRMPDTAIQLLDILIKEKSTVALDCTPGGTFDGFLGVFGGPVTAQELKDDILGLADFTGGWIDVSDGVINSLVGEASIMGVSVPIVSYDLMKSLTDPGYAVFGGWVAKGLQRAAATGPVAKLIVKATGGRAAAAARVPGQVYSRIKTIIIGVDETNMIRYSGGRFAFGATEELATEIIEENLAQIAASLSPAASPFVEASLGASGLKASARVRINADAKTKIKSELLPLFGRSTSSRGDLMIGAVKPDLEGQIGFNLEGRTFRRRGTGGEVTIASVGPEGVTLDNGDLITDIDQMSRVIDFGDTRVSDVRSDVDPDSDQDATLNDMLGAWNQFVDRDMFRGQSSFEIMGSNSIEAAGIDMSQFQPGGAISSSTSTSTSTSSANAQNADVDVTAIDIADPNVKNSVANLVGATLNARVETALFDHQGDIEAARVWVDLDQTETNRFIGIVKGHSDNPTIGPRGVVDAVDKLTNMESMSSIDFVDRPSELDIDSTGPATGDTRIALVQELMVDTGASNFLHRIKDASTSLADGMSPGDVDVEAKLIAMAELDSMIQGVTSKFQSDADFDTIKSEVETFVQQNSARIDLLQNLETRSKVTGSNVNVFVDEKSNAGVADALDEALRPDMGSSDYHSTTVSDSDVTLDDVEGHSLKAAIEKRVEAGVEVTAQQDIAWSQGTISSGSKFNLEGSFRCSSCNIQAWKIENGETVAGTMHHSQIDGLTGDHLDSFLTNQMLDFMRSHTSDAKFMQFIIGSEVHLGHNVDKTHKYITFRKEGTELMLVADWNEAGGWTHIKDFKSPGRNFEHNVALNRMNQHIERMKNQGPTASRSRAGVQASQTFTSQMVTAGVGARMRDMGTRVSALTAPADVGKQYYIMGQTGTFEFTQKAGGTYVFQVKNREGNAVKEVRLNKDQLHSEHIIEIDRIKADTELKSALDEIHSVYDSRLKGTPGLLQPVGLGQVLDMIKSKVIKPDPAMRQGSNQGIVMVEEGGYHADDTIPPMDNDAYNRAELVVEPGQKATGDNLAVLGGAMVVYDQRIVTQHSSGSIGNGNRFLLTNDGISLSDPNVKYIILSDADYPAVQRLLDSMSAAELEATFGTVNWRSKIISQSHADVVDLDPDVAKQGYSKPMQDAIDADTITVHDANRIKTKHQGLVELYDAISTDERFGPDVADLVFNEFDPQVVAQMNPELLDVIGIDPAGVDISRLPGVELEQVRLDVLDAIGGQDARVFDNNRLDGRLQQEIDLNPRLDFRADLEALQSDIGTAYDNKLALEEDFEAGNIEEGMRNQNREAVSNLVSQPRGGRDSSIHDILQGMLDNEDLMANLNSYDRAQLHAAMARVKFVQHRPDASVDTLDASLHSFKQSMDASRSAFTQGVVDGEAQVPWMRANLEGYRGAIDHKHGNSYNAIFDHKQKDSGHASNQLLNDMLNGGMIDGFDFVDMDPLLILLDSGDRPVQGFRARAQGQSLTDADQAAIDQSREVAYELANVHNREFASIVQRLIDGGKISGLDQLKNTAQFKNMFADQAVVMLVEKFNAKYGAGNEITVDGAPATTGEVRCNNCLLPTYRDNGDQINLEQIQDMERTVDTSLSPDARRYIQQMTTLTSFIAIPVYRTIIAAIETNALSQARARTLRALSDTNTTLWQNDDSITERSIDIFIQKYVQGAEDPRAILQEIVEIENGAITLPELVDIFQGLRIIISEHTEIPLQEIPMEESRSDDERDTSAIDATMSSLNLADAGSSPTGNVVLVINAITGNVVSELNPEEQRKMELASTLVHAMQENNIPLSYERFENLVDNGRSSNGNKLPYSSEELAPYLQQVVVEKTIGVLHQQGKPVNADNFVDNVIIVSSIDAYSLLPAFSRVVDPHGCTILASGCADLDGGKYESIGSYVELSSGQIESIDASKIFDTCLDSTTLIEYTCGASCGKEEYVVECDDRCITPANVDRRLQAYGAFCGTAIDIVELEQLANELPLDFIGDDGVCDNVEDGVCDPDCDALDHIDCKRIVLPPAAPLVSNEGEDKDWVAINLMLMLGVLLFAGLISLLMHYHVFDFDFYDLPHEIHEFVKKNRQAGVHDHHIKKALLVAGWKSHHVEQALKKKHK